MCDIIGCVYKNPLPHEFAFYNKNANVLTNKELKNFKWKGLPIYSEHKYGSEGLGYVNKVSHDNNKVVVGIKLKPEFKDKVLKDIKNGTYNDLSLTHFFCNGVDTPTSAEISLVKEGNRPDTKIYDNNSEDCFYYRQKWGINENNIKNKMTDIAKTEMPKEIVPEVKVAETPKVVETTAETTAKPEATTTGDLVSNIIGDNERLMETLDKRDKEFSELKKLCEALKSKVDSYESEERNKLKSSLSKIPEIEKVIDLEHASLDSLRNANNITILANNAMLGKANAEREGSRITRYNQNVSQFMEKRGIKRKATENLPEGLARTRARIMDF